MRIIVLYVPVIHGGYIEFFKKYADSVETAYIVGPTLVEEHKFLEREIRAIEPESVCSFIRNLQIFKDVRLLDESIARTLNKKDFEIITANEQISLRIAESYFPNATLTRDTVFLRWDEASVLSNKVPLDAKISEDPFDISMMKHAQGIAHQSSDWWRHVGAVLVKDRKIVLDAFNSHVPSEQTQYAFGDPRDFVKAGTSPEISTTLHSEQRIITEAAKQGIALLGSDIYTTVFPCPMCAKQIAYSGIKKCYYASGHASLDGESILRASGVELIFVPTEDSEV